ncbi:MAG: hypothetical protein ACLGHM_06655, partial [Actinomycetes bacterium]
QWDSDRPRRSFDGDRDNRGPRREGDRPQRSLDGDRGPRRDGDRPQRQWDNDRPRRSFDGDRDSRGPRGPRQGSHHAERAGREREGFEERTPNVAGIPLTRSQSIEVPEIPEEITYSQLDKAVRARLRTLSKDNAEDVACT